jgi:UDP-glucose 4-epimerase
MKIFVTGAAGFIGGHLFKRLIDLGHEVVGIDNFFHASKNPIASKVINRDIRSDLSDFVKQADIVYHLAAQIHVDYSILHPKETFDINVDGTLGLLELCREHGKKMVFASSSEIYGSAQKAFIDEHHPTHPQSPYAATKLAGDKICQVYKDVYGMRVDVIRNFNTFGEYQNDTSYGGVIAIFTRKALAGEPLEIFGDGTQERDYMYIDDALHGYLMSLEGDLKEPTNFGTGRSITINELAEKIVKITGSNSAITHITPRPGEVQRLCAGINLARSLGFEPKTDFDRDLARYINWYRETFAAKI